MHESDWSVNFRICTGTTRELTHWLISRDTGSSGGAQPIKIAQCFLHGSHWLVSLRNLCGHNQGLTRLVETGDLQPLQNLNQLTTLNLVGCRNLIGQSVSGFVRAQSSQSTAIFFLDWRGFEPTTALTPILSAGIGIPGLIACFFVLCR